jgi:TonB family protein
MIPTALLPLLLAVAPLHAQDDSPSHPAPLPGGERGDDKVEPPPGADTDAPAPPPVPHQDVEHTEVPHVDVPHQEVQPDDPEPGDPEIPPPPATEDRDPVLLANATPDYPQSARDQGIQGDVIVLIELRDDGTVASAELVQAPHELLAWPSLEAARQLLFEPAIRDGQPVAVQLHYRFRFDLGTADETGQPVPGSLHARVLDPDGLGVPGASVRLLNLDDATAEVEQLEVEDDGSFSALFLPSGHYKLVVDHPAFSTTEAEIEIRAGEVLSRSVTLFPTGSYEMVVSYETRTWREVERAPLEADQSTVTGAYELTRRDIEANPGSLEDVSRAVHSLPGVVSDGDMLASFHARGGETDDVVFMLDRVPLQNPFHLAGFNSMFNPDMIAGVDFFAGAAPADVPAGSSAVLAVESWDGEPEQDGDAMDGALDISASSLRAHVMGPVGENTSFALAARRSYLETYFQVMKWMNLLDTAFAAPEYSEISARFAWRPDARHRVIATAMRSGDSLALVNSEDASLINFEGQLELDNNLSLISLDHRFEASEQLTLHSTTAWTRDRSFLLRDMGGEYRQDVLTNRWYGRSDLYVKAGPQKRHDISGGVDFSYIAVDADGLIEDTRTDPTWFNAPLASYDHPQVALAEGLVYPEGSAYLQETWEGPVKLRLGGRATATGSTGELLLSPRAGLSIPLPTGTVPKASWGIYHKTPRDPRVFDVELGNPHIESEQAIHYVVGLDQAFPLPGEEAGGLLRVEGYYIDLSNLVVNPDNQDAIDRGVTYTNDGSGTNKGIDAMLGARAGRLQSMVTYSFLIAERTNPLNEVFAQTFAPAQDQRHTLGAALEYQLTPHWRTTARYSFHTGRPVSTVDVVEGEDLVELSCLNCERMGNFHNLDLRAEWRKAMRHYRLTFYVEVLNATYFQSDFVPTVSVVDGVREDGMFSHLPTRPFIGVRADF